jgi:hypothetical protein
MHLAVVNLATHIDHRIAGQRPFGQSRPDALSIDGKKRSDRAAKDPGGIELCRNQWAEA